MTTEREMIALHLDRLAKRVRGASHVAAGEVAALADQVRDNALPALVIDEPGPEVRTVFDPLGNPVRRAVDGSGWIWWAGRSGNRPVWSWETVRDGFGPLTLDDPSGSETR